jgi:predicted nucleic acid-binding Zn ribbon protein
MECRECGKAVDEGELSISVWGQFCSDSCREEFHRRRHQRHAELRAEPLFQAPAELTVPDFDTFALKVAVYASLNLDAVQDLPKGLRDPDILALQVKEVLLRHLPEEYASTWQEGSGWSRKERYSFRKPIPMELVRGAMQEAGFEWQVAWFGTGAERAFFFTELGAKWRAIRDQILRTIDEHIRALAETAPGIESTATLRIDSSVLEPLMKHIERLDAQWRFHHHLAAEGISKARDVSARDALEILDGLEHSLRVLTLGPASAA